MGRAAVVGTVLAVAGLAGAQTAGGSAFGQRRGNPADVLRQQRELSEAQVPPTLNSAFLDAAVLMNVRADVYVTTFGLSEEGATNAEARAKVGARLAAFRARLRGAGVAAARVATDIVAQNRVYGYALEGNVATERLQGFEFKENVSVRCRSQAEVDAMVALAARDGIFDLVKVDYVVSDLAAVRVRLREEAARAIARKRVDYARLFGMRFGSAPQVYAERYDAFYPTDAYASYQAAEGENLDRVGYGSGNVTVHGARKVRTFYYDPLTTSGFDRVVNPVVTVPVVQCTLYLRLRYESGPDRRPTRPGK